MGSTKDVARMMGIQEKGVEKQVSRGMRLLGEALTIGRIPPQDQDTGHSPKSESEHG